MDAVLQETRKAVTIVVNGRRVSTDKTELSFDEVVALSDLPTGPDIVFTVTYRKGPAKNRQGSMVEGGPAVEIKEDMIFNVSSTNRS